MISGLNSIIPYGLVDYCSDSRLTAIVKAISSMSQSLRLQVIAEGVETEIQRDFLARHGCNHYQGYFFGRPMPGEAFEALLH